MVKVPLDTRERSSCTSIYWDPAFPHLKLNKKRLGAKTTCLEAQCFPHLWFSTLNTAPFQFIHTMDLSVVDTMLHDSRDLVIHRTESWAVWMPQVRPKNVSRFLTQQFNCCTCTPRRNGALSSWKTKSLPDTLRIAGRSMTSLWRREAASKKSVRDIIRISCFVTTMRLPHA